MRNVGLAGTAEHVERIVRGWRRMDGKAEAEAAVRQHTSRALHLYPDEDGTVRIRGRLAPEVGALLLKALAAARETLYQQARGNAPEADPPTMEQQQADALALLAETALHHGLDPGSPGSATRWSSTSTPRCWATRRPPASRSWKTARAFQLERPGAWRATPAGW